MNHAPALIYSTHRMLVVWITLAHFHICSLLATLSRYTTLEVWAVRRPMRVCCDSRWEQWVLFINTLDSLLAPCLVYNTAMYIVYGRCGQYGRCMDHTLAGIYSLFLCAASARADVPLQLDVSIALLFVNLNGVDQSRLKHRRLIQAIV